MTRDEFVKQVEETAAAVRAAGGSIQSNESAEWIFITLADGVKTQDGVTVGLKDAKTYTFLGEETHEYFDQSNDLESWAAWVNFDDWMLWQAVGWG